jgi:hypothetical protein
MMTAADALGDQQRSGLGPRPGRGRRIAAAGATLTENGYEPRAVSETITLTNCPFDALAREQTELVCGMNVALLGAVADRVGDGMLAARLEPADDVAASCWKPADPDRSLDRAVRRRSAGPPDRPARHGRPCRDWAMTLQVPERTAIAARCCLLATLVGSSPEPLQLASAAAVVGQAGGRPARVGAAVTTRACEPAPPAFRPERRPAVPGRS